MIWWKKVLQKLSWQSTLCKTLKSARMTHWKLTTSGKTPSAKATYLQKMLSEKKRFILIVIKCNQSKIVQCKSVRHYNFNALIDWSICFFVFFYENISNNYKLIVFSSKLHIFFTHKLKHLK